MLCIVLHYTAQAQCVYTAVYLQGHLLQKIPPHLLDPLSIPQVPADPGCLGKLVDLLEVVLMDGDQGHVLLGHGGRRGGGACTGGGWGGRWCGVLRSGI